MSIHKMVPISGLVNILTGALVGFVGTDGLEYMVENTCLQGANYLIPTSGITITLAPTVKTTVLEPAGTLAALTVKMPLSPVDQQVVHFSTSQILTALTVSPNTGQTMANGLPTSAAAGQGFEFIWNAAQVKWYRIQ